MGAKNAVACSSLRSWRCILKTGVYAEARVVDVPLDITSWVARLVSACELSLSNSNACTKPRAQVLAVPGKPVGSVRQVLIGPCLFLRSCQRIGSSNRFYQCPGVRLVQWVGSSGVGVRIHMIRHWLRVRVVYSALGRLTMLLILSRACGFCLDCTCVSHIIIIDMILKFKNQNIGM